MRSSLLPLVTWVLGLAMASSSAAQTCPYDPDEAIEDSTSAQSYLPLQIGNQWIFDRVVRPEDNLGYLILEIVGDTLVEDQIHFKVRTRRIGGQDGDTDSCCTYWSIDENGHFYEGVGPGRFSWIRLGQSFNSCYEGDGGMLVEVDSAYGVWQDQQAKQFANAATLRIYAPMLGLVQYGEQSLIYARVGDYDWGSRDSIYHILSIGSTDSDFGFASLSAYPNPASTHIAIDFGESTSHNVYSVKILDTIGRVVITDQSAIGNLMSINISNLSRGTYFILAEPIANTGVPLYGAFIVQ